MPPRVVVVGAGAAGTMAAIFAAASGADTVLLERTRDGGRKILISGGGRCNILPAEVDESRFVTDSPRQALRRIVRSWPLREQVAFFEIELALPLFEEPGSGKLFLLSQSARDVRDRLLAFARRKGVGVATGVLVTNVQRHGEKWTIECDSAEPLEADAVILATGGLSVPATGSDGRGLQIARQLGHVVHDTYPALTPLTSTVRLTPDTTGIALPVTITARAASRRAEATGGLLFTHHGYSGPAVLDVSHVAVRSLTDPGGAATLTVRWTPLGEREWDDALRAGGSRTVAAALGAELPRRLADALAATAGIAPERRLSHLHRHERLRLIDVLVRGPLPWSAHEGYRKAEVTGGGVSLSDVDTRTLESRRHKRLYFCGEMLDAFGPIGGYNFLWAWATGKAAGMAAARCYA